MGKKRKKKRLETEKRKIQNLACALESQKLKAEQLFRRTKRLFKSHSACTCYAWYSLFSTKNDYTCSCNLPIIVDRESRDRKSQSHISVY